MRKALVAGDDDISRRTLVRIAEEYGLATFQCSSGERALELLWDNPDVSLIIADLALTSMRGPELARQIKANPQLKKVPVIVLNSAPTKMPFSPKDSLSLLKPVSPDDLRSALAEFFPASSRVDPLRTSGTIFL